MKFVPHEQVEWRKTGILRDEDRSFEYTFDLPRPLADWDVWDYWERERFHSMRDHLKPGMALFDVGTEQGWCNLIYASMVGPGSMVLIEPTKEFWPNIKATWERNYETAPALMYSGLLSDKTTDQTWQWPGWRVWPECASGDLIDRNKYQYIHEHSGDVPEMRLDDLYLRSGIVPAAITMDVEGAELLVLRGAQHVLREYHPLVWISIHPDLGERDYGVKPAQVHAFMESFGYTGTHLADDHESHWFFQ